MATKLVKNTTNSDIILKFVGRTVPANTNYLLSPSEYALWAEQESLDEIDPLIQTGDIIINNGNVDLPSNIALSHVRNSVRFVHEDVSLLPGAGENAPALTSISPAAVGFRMEIGDKIYGQTRIDGLLGNFVEFQIHYTIDNSEASRFVQFDFSYFTTNGRSDSKQITANLGSTTTGPELLETTPFIVREAVVNIPSSDFSSGENYLFVGITRVPPSSGNSPINQPLILRYCKRYYKVDN